MTLRKRDAEKVLASVKDRFKGWFDTDEYGPQLVKDWDWLGTGPTPYAIVWEEGPYDWALLATGGGRTEFGFTVDPIDQPKAVFAEPITGWALGLYPN